MSILILGILYSDTTCSSDAYLRGSGQKVISYTFYGDINTPKSKKKGTFGTTDMVLISLEVLIMSKNSIVSMNMFRLL